MKVQWTEPAVEDLESIHEYIGRDSEVYAISFIEKVLNTVDILEEIPEIGRMVPEAKDANIRKNSIQIIAVIRGSRDISKWPLKPWEIK